MSSSTVPVLFLRALHIAQAALAAYGTYHSYIAITNLRKYEGMTKKAAKWSNEAQFQLDRTRTTQGAGAVVILASILASVTLAFVPFALPKWLRSCTSPALLVGTLAARQHIKGFWTKGESDSVGTRIPLPQFDDFNEAQRKTAEILKVTEWLEYSWVVASLGWGMVPS